MKKKKRGGLLTYEGKVLAAVTLVWALYTLFIVLVTLEVFR
mgnify:FL=1|jgi:hypothetical protein|nr:MAG TPA: hypothetical protein [Caudoviricetes sp.]